MSARRCVVGVDGGGSRTTCLLVDVDGNEVARATGGAANLQRAGEDGVRRVLAGLLAQVAGRAGGAIEVAGMCLGLAGADRPGDRAALERVAGALAAEPPDGMWFDLDGQSLVLVNDAVVALVGGTGARRGVVTVAGTGSIAFGLNTAGQRARAGGWGYLLGDEGGGYAVALAGLRAVCRAADGRAPATALTAALLAAHGVDQPSDLISVAYGKWDVTQIAGMAPLVLDAAGEGDAVALAIVREAAAELALATRAVITALGMERAAVEVVTAGGLWQGSPLLRAAFVERLREAVPAEVIWPRQDAAAGAALLAGEAIGAMRLD